MSAFPRFSTIERICDGREGIVAYGTDALAVGVAQLIVAIIALVISIRRK
jgi:hypothetical protein